MSSANDAATATPAKPRAGGARTPLARDDWRYVERPTLDDMTRDDWQQLKPQQTIYYREQAADRALALLACQRDAPSYGYPLNAYGHCLQTATRVLRDGHAADTVVCALFHDVFLDACDANHGPAAAELLRPYVSDGNYWMLRHHGVFIMAHCASAPGVDVAARERWRGHPHYAWTVEFVDRYDQRSMRADEDALPLSTFEPLVREVFAGPRPTPLDD